MNLPLWYKIVSVFFLIFLLPSLLLLTMAVMGFIKGDILILIGGLLPSFVGILFEILIVLTALLKKSWKFFLLTQGIFLITWLFLWLLSDGINERLGVGLIVILSLLPIIFNKKIIGNSSR